MNEYESRRARFRVADDALAKDVERQRANEIEKAAVSWSESADMLYEVFAQLRSSGADPRELERAEGVVAGQLRKWRDLYLAAREINPDSLIEYQRANYRPSQ